MIDLAADRWVALRALNEGAMPSHELLGLATGRSVASIAKRAEREGWVDCETALAARLRRVDFMIDGLIEEIEAIGAAGEGGFDKSRIDAVAAMTRTLEKIGEITRGGESAKENQIKQDEDIAGILKRIDDRIVELAGEYAKELVARERAVEAGAKDRQ